MATTRTEFVRGLFAGTALTTIPADPISGVSYRNEALPAADIESGWEFDTPVPSEEFNQIMFELFSVLRQVDKRGILGYNDLVDYDIVPAFAAESDGEIYKSLDVNGPNTPDGVQDPVVDSADNGGPGLFWEVFSSGSGGGVGNIIFQQFTRAGGTLATGQTSFTLPSAPASQNGLIVIENNTVNVNRALAANIVTLTDAIAEDVDTVTIIGFAEIAIPTTGDGTVTLPKFAPGTLGTLLGFNAVTGAAEHVARSSLGFQFLPPADLSLGGNAEVVSGIPADATEIEIIFSETSGTSGTNWQLRVGTSAAIVNTGYVSTTIGGVINNVVTGLSATTFFNVYPSIAYGPTNNLYGSIRLNRLAPTSNIWVIDGALGRGDTALYGASGQINVGGTLDRIELSLSSGNFDNGILQVKYR